MSVYVECLGLMSVYVVIYILEHYQTAAGRCQQTLIKDLVPVYESCAFNMEEELEKKIMTIPDMACG